MVDVSAALDLDEVVIDPSCALQVPAAFALERKALPLCIVDGDMLVAMVDPTDVKTLAEIRRELGMAAVGIRTDAASLDRTLAKVYGDVQAVLAGMRPDDAVSTVDFLLRTAFLRRASDIHFDSDEGGLRVRFRIDGELEDVMRVPPALQPSVVSRLKVMGDVKLDERRAPQDGSFVWAVPEAIRRSSPALDVRLATLPGRYGEKVTLRLLEADSRRFTMDSLCLSESDFGTFDRVLAAPHGLVLLTGPTGSGKSTTLYAAIQHILNGRNINVITVENPIEYEIPGAFQAEVDAVDKVNFGKALRSILRHDPDVVMIGEIRDRESLDTAVKAALTGHLVLSTLHTNDSINAVTRLANMGLERHLIAASLRLSVAQRLVRSLCPHCRATCAASDEDARLLGRGDLVGETVYHPKGCVYCAGKGYLGRIGLFELFRPDVEVASAIADGANEHEIRRLHRAKGGRFLVDDGIDKCLTGLTSVGEVGRVSFYA